MELIPDNLKIGGPKSREKKATGGHKSQSTSFAVAPKNQQMKTYIDNQVTVKTSMTGLVAS